MMTTPEHAHPAIANSTPLSPIKGSPLREDGPHRAPLAAATGEELEGLPLPRPPTREPAATPLYMPRCTTRGCVFPASDLQTGRCHSHDLQESEPALFESLQPILHVLAQAKFALASQDCELEDERRLQRRLKAALRRAFLEGGA